MIMAFKDIETDYVTAKRL